MVLSVTREFKWLPTQLAAFFIDGQDFYGLEYWYNDVKTMAEAMKKNSSKKK